LLDCSPSVLYKTDHLVTYNREEMTVDEDLGEGRCGTQSLDVAVVHVIIIHDDASGRDVFKAVLIEHCIPQSFLCHGQSLAGGTHTPAPRRRTRGHDSHRSRRHA
jgi:hypothetical protein